MVTEMLTKVCVILMVMNLADSANETNISTTLSCEDYECTSNVYVEEESSTGIEFYINNTFGGKTVPGLNERQNTPEDIFKNPHRSLKDEIEYIKQFDAVPDLNIENSISTSNISRISEKTELRENVTESLSLTSENGIKSELTENTINTSSTEQIPTSSVTNEISNRTVNASNTVFKRNSKDKNYKSDICMCDLKVNECDINCCCDQDCSTNMKKIFTGCKDSGDSLNHDYCFSSSSLFQINLEHKIVGSGLFCIAKSNFKPVPSYKVETIIENPTQFKKRIGQKKFFSYSTLHFDEPKIGDRSYLIGDYIWAVLDGLLVPFGLPGHNVNLQCNSVKYIHYLSDYSTQCVQSIPRSRSKCEWASNLEMNYYLKGVNIIKSPALLKEADLLNTSKICKNQSNCISVRSYICDRASDIPNCIQSSPRRVSWDRGICRNVVNSVNFHIYHNGTEGIQEARAYFSLRNIPSDELGQFKQTINLKFLWVDSPVLTFVRSGNPGYIIGKPIMSGRKIFSSNDTTLVKKEAIELSYDSKNWLTATGTKNGFCSLMNRKSITFGENVQYSCLIELDRYDLLKKKCSGLQEGIFRYFFGDDFMDMKLNNRYNKYVATLGNSRPEETGDWVQVAIDILPIVSSQIGFTSHYGGILCKNIYSNLNIDMAYAKIGSFDKPQHKILGVYFYFGSPVKVFYSNNSGCGILQSSQTLRISTSIRFIDLTSKPKMEFAETPGFEAKLPHDFFYPFFSESSVSVHPHFVLISITLAYQFFLVNNFKCVNLV